MKYPSITYRVQLHKDFTFSHLENILPYLRKLGVDTIYASPITKARAGSTHGYDVIEPLEINPEIGTLEELRHVTQMLKQYDMMWIQDIVPNHMAFHESNWRLYDLLQRGTASPYYIFFDINWSVIENGATDKLIIPVLDDDVEKLLDRDELSLQWTDKGVQLCYGDKYYPISAKGYIQIADVCQNTFPILIQELVVRENGSYEEWQRAQQSFVQQVNAEPRLEGQMKSCLQCINADRRLLAEIISEQHYELAKWNDCNKRMNYRRFFAVNELISLQMNRQTVFDEYHTLITQLYKDGLIQGVRVDHIDGLYHPRAYVQQLRQLLGADCYIVVEKILEYNEDLSEDWNIQGTTGYEFLAYTNQLLTSKEGATDLKKYFVENISGPVSYDDLVFQKKYAFLENYMSGEWDNLLQLLKQQQVLQGQAFTMERLRYALGILLSSFTVYRLYPDGLPFDEESMRLVNLAFNSALLREPDFANEFEILKSVFEAHNDNRDEQRLHFIRRLMQFTGPLAAKGVEDTTFYVYNPLISHNEVGDCPAHLGITVDEFHHKMISRQQRNPYSLNATSTHDTKRGEDARMRINVLAEMPGEWITHVGDWRMMNAPFRTMLKDKEVPSFNEEYFMYQSLIGSFPVTGDIDDTFKQRTRDVVLKALHEAKEHTTYELPNGDYESACLSFVEKILTSETFLQSFLPFLQKIWIAAKVYSITQVVMKITAPGIPDIYNGAELWETSYVDPDNRGVVDFKQREQLLAVINGYHAQPGFFQWLEEYSNEGAQKMFAIQQVANYRCKHASLFLSGDYIPIVVQNGKADAVAYARVENDKWVLTVLPLSIIQHSKQNENAAFFWEKIWLELPEGAPTHWYNIFTGAEVTATHSVLNLGEVFEVFSVAVLEGR